MPIQNSTLLAGATLSAAGGTTFTLTVDGTQVKSGVHVADASVADFRIRPNATFKARMPSKKADGSYQKGKNSVTLVRPKVLANGVVDYPLVRIDIEYSAESTDAEITALMNQGAQLLFDADFTNFFKTGSLL